MPDLEGAETIEEVDARFEEAFVEARRRLVDMYTIKEGDSKKVAGIVKKEVIDVLRESGGEYVPGVEAVIQIDDTIKTLQDERADLWSKVVAVGLAVASVWPGGGAAGKGAAKLAVEEALKRSAKEIAEKAFKVGDKAVEFKALSKNNYRDRLIDFLGVSKESVADLEAHHLLVKHREPEWAGAIARKIGVSEDVGRQIVHHPRFLRMLDKTKHGVVHYDKALKGRLDDVLEQMAESGVPPSFDEMWSVVKEVHDEAGIPIQFFR